MSASDQLEESTARTNELSRAVDVLASGFLGRTVGVESGTAARFQSWTLSTAPGERFVDSLARRNRRPPRP
jgi:hypothetical protein